MAANIPNMGAINAVGGQFNSNVFDRVQEGLKKSAVKSQRKHVQAQKERNNARQDWANSVNETLKTAHAGYAKEDKAKQTAAKKAATAHAAGVKSGRVAPTPGTAPRTFAMAPTAQQKSQVRAQGMQQRAKAAQVNTAHGEGLKEANQRGNVMRQQRNYAHGQAIGMQNQMDRAATKAQMVNQLSNPGKTKSTAPTETPAGQFPMHQEPVGFDRTLLPNLTASQPKPNEFTVQSRRPNASSQGIGAMGSKLEASMINKPMSIPERKRRV